MNGLTPLKSLTDVPKCSCKMYVKDTDSSNASSFTCVSVWKWNDVTEEEQYKNVIKAREMRHTHTKNEEVKTCERLGKSHI